MAMRNTLISDLLIPKLQERFVGKGLRLGVPPSPVAVFPAIHSEVGDIEIYDDGDELTLVAGHFTHGHFSNYDEHLTADEKAQQIVEDIISYLEEFFEDRIVMWGSHKTSGGTYHREHADAWAEEHTIGMKKFVWSGPLEA